MTSVHSMPPRSLGRSISHLHMDIRSYLQKELAPYNIGSGQVHFLLTLYRNNGVRQEYLTEISLVDKATTTRAIKKLESEGYVHRKRDAKDGRRYRVFLTRKGKEIKPIIRRVLDEWTDRMLSDFSHSEREQLFGFLDRLERSSGDLK